jgi:hypothetical protein
MSVSNAARQARWGLGRSSDGFSSSVTAMPKQRALNSTVASCYVASSESTGVGQPLDTFGQQLVSGSRRISGIGTHARWRTVRAASRQPAEWSAPNS